MTCVLAPARTRRVAYGYMQVPSTVADEKVFLLEQALRDFALDRGLRLAGFFFEFSRGSHEAFEELLATLRREDTHYVVVPTWQHLARSPLLQNLMLEQLESTADAEVFVLREAREHTGPELSWAR
ncbi:recombinase family protein [Amycolatopsis sp. NPDC059021]|uniref:recombinase family protein n=1 Tax=Amycolatopsis sp. NPDC059021 TaxID=3346704 RepID=UPI00366C91F4